MEEQKVVKRMPAKKPNVNSDGERELMNTKAQFDEFDSQIKEMTLDRMNQAPREEREEQTKLSQVELSRKKDLYLKPKRQNGPGRGEKFNEDFRTEYEYQKEYVHFIAENHEIIGESIEIWTKPFPGMNVEFWEVPVNTPIWGPRYLAEQIKRKSYHRLVMSEEEKSTNYIGSDNYGRNYGKMVIDTTVPRLDARPVSNRKSVFIGANGY